MATESPDVAELQAAAADGMRTLDVSEAVVESALGHLNQWLTGENFKDYRHQIHYLIRSEKWEVLLDSFYQVIPFGTGGRRGPVGIGPNRINPWTIQASAQGHSQYLIQQYGDDAGRRGVVLAFDVRQYSQEGVYDDSRPNPVKGLDGKQLAIAAAEVYAANQIKVHLFETARSTPELSFAIRHLGAVSGDMFSASHNLPTDNGKKIYDAFGGQLIPPHDQALVEEVTENVRKIRRMAFEKACERGLVAMIGQEVDDAYLEAVCGVSLSPQRNVRVLFSPLHGTGLTTVYPVLKRLGVDIHQDPATSNMSGAFENVTFNIPNPEVIESFDHSLPNAEKLDADLLLSTDPDADRIGVLVKHRQQWHFLTGNEIGILLTHYALTKFKETGRLDRSSLVIKTAVTTSLIEKIAVRHGIRCKGDLLVGFKYIADVMNRLEAEGRIDDFIFGTEESHGYISGNYVRDKDAAGAAVWISEHAAELKADNQTLVDALDRIYADYGYCHNYLTEIRLLGARGMQQILSIMDHLRGKADKTLDGIEVNRKTDRWEGDPQPHLSRTDTSARNVIGFDLNPPDGAASARITVRPSGTEPKIKMYFEVVGAPCRLEQLADEKQRVTAIRRSLEETFMQYCYRLIGVDFPKRGFLLFWQLPLADKLKYFDIEEDIAALRTIAEPEARREALSDMLAFLGANPFQKVNRAFAARYGKDLLTFLDLENRQG
jgi:phosphoglucomutase/phosphomannomutase